MRTFRFYIVAFLCLCLVFSSCSSEKSGWKGTIKDENGVKVVKNPQSPMFENTDVSIEEDLSIGNEPEKNSLFFSISDIEVDETGRIYILDTGEKNIKVYDSQGSWIQTVGGPGQGPGEMSGPVSLACSSENIVVLDGMFAGKVICYDALGGYIDSFPINEGWVYKLETDFKDHYLMLSLKMGNENESNVCVGMYDSRMELLWEVDRIPVSYQNKILDLFSPTPWFDFDHSGNVVYGYPSEYEIRIYESDGTLIKKIRRTYTPVEVSSEAKESAQKSMKVVMPLSFRFPRHYPAYQRFYPDGQGRLFVRTWEKEKGEYLYDVFDAQGRYTHQILLPNGLVCIKQGKPYCLEKDEEGFQILKRYRISGLEE